MKVLSFIIKFCQVKFSKHHPQFVEYDMMNQDPSQIAKRDHHNLSHCMRSYCLFLSPVVPLNPLVFHFEVPLFLQSVL
jgi:hypothetical protein